MKESLTDDLAAVASIEAVRTILEVVCRTTGMGFSAVARVTDDRWIARAVRDEIAFGLVPGSELVVGTTICDEIRQHGTTVAIDHVATDPQFCDHATPRMYGFQSYISVPIYRVDGQFFGTLCAIDPRPATVNTTTVIGMFRLFGELIALDLDAMERVAAGELALRDERRSAELREQFIAVLGHDLRNPLASIGAAAEVLHSRAADPGSTSVVEMIERSVGRMSELIGNILDFARGRLGGGITVVRVADARLPAVLAQVIAELQSIWPGRRIETNFALARTVSCDPERIGQLFSNLLANALAHGDPEAAVRVDACVDETGFELAVVNRGVPIPPATIAHLFQPFSRALTRSGREGLGLGLYIASEIARAHDGSLAVVSSPGETRFTFRMPHAAAATAS